MYLTLVRPTRPAITFEPQSLRGFMWYLSNNLHLSPVSLLRYLRDGSALPVRNGVVRLATKHESDNASLEPVITALEAAWKAGR